MKNSFDHITNGWLYKTCKAIGDAVIISVLFLLFCLPIVTIGPSVTALYYTVYRKYTKKIDNVSKDFMHSLKDNLKDGTIINIGYLLYSAVVGFNIYFAFFGFGEIRLPGWYRFVSLIPLVLVIFSLPFVYALLARFSNGIKATLKNSFTLCLMNLPQIILIWLIILITLAVSICFPPAALLTPVGAARLCQMITEKAFRSAISVENARNNSDETSSEASEDDSDEEDDEDSDREEGSEEDEDDEEQESSEGEDEENG